MENTPVTVVLIETYMRQIFQQGGTTSKWRPSVCWYRLDRNPPVFSCRQAARHRLRLGRVGIPLWDELKSLVYEYQVGTEKRWAALHLRGDRRVNSNLLRGLLHPSNDGVLWSEERVDLSPLGMAYGTVNPFLLHLRHMELVAQNPAFPPLVHVLDQDLLLPAGPPGSVMTNAGEPTWSIEFDPNLLYLALPNSLQGAFSEPDEEIDASQWGVRNRQSIGIITGNTPESGALLWDIINQTIRKKLRADNLETGDLAFPETFIHSMPEMTGSMELAEREGQLWKVIHDSVRRLERAGVEMIAIACNTTQYFANQIRRSIDSGDTLPDRDGEKRPPEFISMPESVASLLKLHGVNEVGLIGIHYVTDPRFSAYFQALEEKGIRIHVSDDTDLIYNLALKIKERGALPSYVASLNGIIQRMPVEHVILALTEFSYLISKQKKYTSPHGKHLIDPLVVYGEAIACKYLKRPFPEASSKICEYASWRPSLEVEPR